MLDTAYSIETPEGVDIDLRAAGPVPRFIAWVIDLALKLVIWIGTMLPAMLLGATGAGVWAIVFFVVDWFYPVLFEVLAGGATPGKKVMRLQVVHRDGTPVGWGASIARNLLRWADWLPFGYGFGLTAMLFSPGFQRLGDLAAGTLVVYRDALRRAARIPEVAPLPPPVPLRLAEQRAVIGFGQRAATLAPARARELAGIAAPLVAAQPGRVDDPLRLLYGVAAWLVGRRDAA